MYNMYTHFAFVVKLSDASPGLKLESQDLIVSTLAQDAERKKRGESRQ
jgi:hypothetical protein